MEVSIGIMAYNEGKNVGLLLKSIFNQKLKKIKIKEIVVVSSGSTDKTNEIVKNFIKKNKKIKLIIQKNREGKFSAINEFLKIAKSEILVLESGDTIPKKDAIENLCKLLNNKNVGIVASCPIPKNDKKNYLGFVIALQWKLHHKLSLQKPKFGELIAFRNLFKEIKNTAVDEEYIAMIIKNLGFKGAYAPDAIVYNTGPKTVVDFLEQRRRIYCGHLELKKKFNYKAASLNNFLVLKIILKNIKMNNIFHIIFASVLECLSRFLGIMDYYSQKEHYIWEKVDTIKK